MITPRVVDEIARQDIIMMLCELSADRGPDYVAMHKMVKCAQKVLETKHNATLGYDFNDPSVYSPWSNALQRDIERYIALGGWIEERNNEIGINTNGERLLKNSGKRYLEGKFGKGIARELKSCMVF
jgi:hypothetical protein